MQELVQEQQRRRKVAESQAAIARDKATRLAAARQAEARRQAESRRRKEQYDLMVTLDGQEVVPSMEPFDCPVCMDQFEAGDGITLKSCLHVFCR